MPCFLLETPLLAWSSWLAQTAFLDYPRPLPTMAHGRVLLTGLLFKICSVCLLRPPWSTRTGMAPITNNLEACPPAKLLRQFIVRLCRHGSQHNNLMIKEDWEKLFALSPSLCEATAKRWSIWRMAILILDSPAFRTVNNKFLFSQLSILRHFATGAWTEQDSL